MKYRREFSRAGIGRPIAALVFAALSLSLSSPSHAQAPGGITLEAAKLLPESKLKGPNYRIDDRVVSDGLLYHYRIDVTEPQGTLEVPSTALLEVRLTELTAMRKLSAMSQTELFKQGAVKAAKSPITFAGDLFEDPGGTLAGAAKGVGSYLDNVGHALFGAKGEGESDAVSTVIGYASVKRTLAADLGVDPYSSNQLLQAELDEVARAAYAGGIGVKALFAAIPGAAGAVVSGTSFAGGMNRILRDNAPADLLDINAAKLKAMGVPRDVAKLLLENVKYSPSNRTYLVAALASMKNVANRALFVRRAAVAADPLAAFLMRRQAEMLAAFNAKIAKGKSFVSRGGVPLLETQDGRLVGTYPVDDVQMSPRLQAWLDRTGPPAKAKPLRQEAWIAGTISDEARARSTAAGWTVIDNARDRLRLE